jgi:outer membrane murein-binding lipoprotein Lpp
MNETDGVGRRDLGTAMAASALLVLAGCAGKGPTVDSELSALADAISSLDSTVRRFSGDDWKDVVPDVQTDASDVANAFANLKAALGKG